VLFSPQSPLSLGGTGKNFKGAVLAHYEHLPIYKGAFDLLIYFEKIVRNFSRYNKYSHGKDLRDLTRKIVSLIVRANNSRDKLPILEEIRICLEELKALIRICKEVQAFPNFNSFQTSINQVIQLSKQNEGWIKFLSTQGKRPELPTHSPSGIGR
jgi:hypothetical protein